jgi:hypothetical protein
LLVPRGEVEESAEAGMQAEGIIKDNCCLNFVLIVNQNLLAITARIRHKFMIAENKLFLIFSKEVFAVALPLKQILHINRSGLLP